MTRLETITESMRVAAVVEQQRLAQEIDDETMAKFVVLRAVETALADLRQQWRARPA